MNSSTAEVITRLPVGLDIENAVEAVASTHARQIARAALAQGEAEIDRILAGW